VGLFMKKTKPDDELLAKGLRGHATVLHVKAPMMDTEMSMSKKKYEEMLRGDTTPIHRKVQLKVEVPGREAYEVETKLNIPVMRSGKLVAGAGLTVLVDPDDPKHLAVDWSAGVEPGPAAAMFADAPMTRAALEGAGYDPQLIAQQIDAARAQSGQPMAAWQAWQAWQTQQAQAAQAGGAPVAGQMPPGWPAGMPPVQLPPGWQMPAGFPQVPGAVPSGVQIPGAVPPGTVPPGSVPPAGGATPAGEPASDPWPDATTNPVGPTSEEKPKD
jgi:hypothetical protein